MDLETFSREHAEWVERNFPDEKDHHPLLGLMEEVGELAHAHLKAEEQVRGFDGFTTDQYREAAADAIGDILIFLEGYCYRCSFVLKDCLDQTWAKVKQRDWQRDPVSGGE